MMTMKILISLLFSAMLTCIAYGQSPDTTWTKTFGGSNYELYGTFATVSQNYGRWADITHDAFGNVYIATTSLSADFDLNSNSGNEDVWILCINALGDTLWTNRLGGSSSERTLRTQSFSSGGCLVVGSSYSTDGSFSSNHSTYSDGFIARYDTLGQLIWMKLYGGTSDDFLYDVIETSDGFLMACGEAYSVDGDLTSSGIGMNWAIKINPDNGNIIWSKTYLGPDGTSPDWLENVFRLTETTDQKIIMTGYTTPIWNDFNLDRISIIQINLDGVFQWKKKIGATGSGDYPTAIISGSQGSFYILGKLAGTIGGADDAANYYGGGGDFWLVHLNAAGTILFEKNYGGSELDVPYDLELDDAGFLYLSGMTRSTDHDAASGILGGTDYWILKVNALGDTVYSIRLGGSSNDFCSGMTLLQTNHTLMLAGGTDSNDGMIQGFMGLRDLWVARLDYPPGTDQNEYVSEIQSFYPNPASDFLYIGADCVDAHSVQIFDMTGDLKTIQNVQSSGMVDLRLLSEGNYFVLITDPGGKPVKKSTIIIVR